MNKEKTIKFLWISMWATLILMVVLKLTFNYYYPLVIENSKLLEISYFIDSNKVLDHTINFVFYISNALLISLCTIQEKWFKKKWHMILLLSMYTIAYPFKVIPWLSMIIVIIPYIIIPLFITQKKKRWIFIMFILDNIFQIATNYARGNVLIICDTALVRKLVWIDYYLLFVIYYIGVCHMGWEGVLPWFTKKETVINAKIEKHNAKIKKLEAKKIELKQKCLKK